MDGEEEEGGVDRREDYVQGGSVSIEIYLTGGEGIVNRRKKCFWEYS